jgi:hypothetical protein
MPRLWKKSVDATDEFEIIEEMETEEVTSFMEIMPSTHRLYLLRATILRLILKLQKKVVLLDYLKMSLKTTEL